MKYQKIFSCDEFIIVNKPAGMLSHSLPNKEEDSLAEKLLKDFPELRKVGEDPSRPGIVHRLDRAVSGLMLIPRTHKSFENLKQQFKNRTIQKYHTALVYGRVLKDYDEINFPISRSAKTGKMIALPATVKGEPNKNGRNSLTLFEIEKKYINYTLLKVQIKTGRTHQVRVHLSAYGFPIVGDNLYGTPKTRLKNKKINLERIFLVASRLSFKDLSGQQRSFKIDLPKDLKEFLKSKVK